MFVREWTLLDIHAPKERIKREAMRLFVEHGVDAVSMRDIADSVGMKATEPVCAFP